MCENITGSYGCKTISEIITAICPDIFMIMSHFPVNQIKSNQIKSKSILPQNHNHIASKGFKICTVNNILCP